MCRKYGIQSFTGKSKLPRNLIRVVEINIRGEMRTSI